MALDPPLDGIPDETDVVTGGALYTRLLEGAHESGDSLVMDLRRFWSVNAICAEAGTIYQVVVYLLFDSVDAMDAASDRLQGSLAVDAIVYHFRTATLYLDEGSIALLFSSFSPLVGPMTYGEVQRAVEHYLGWCDKPRNSVPPWTGAMRVKVELVPRPAMREWCDNREQVLSGCDAKGLWQGCNFHCVPPCGRE